MISEDTEDWSNDAIQLCITGLNDTVKYIKIENIFF